MGYLYSTPKENCRTSWRRYRHRCNRALENEVEGLKGDQDALNEFYRQFPRTEEHAFRDETKNQYI